MHEKDILRKKIKERFKSFSSEKLEQKNAHIIQNLLTFLQTQDFKNIALYTAMKDEVQLQELEKELQKRNKTLFYPEMQEEGNLVFKTKDGRESEKIEIFIIPGRAFSIDGKRLWRGKWCYDQYFGTRKNTFSLKIWIWFDFQIVENIPTQQHDILLDKIISNEI